MNLAQYHNKIRQYLIENEDEPFYFIHTKDLFMIGLRFRYNDEQDEIRIFATLADDLEEMDNFIFDRKN